MHVGVNRNPQNGIHTLKDSTPLGLLGDRVANN
jgi:hypothetical protein